MTKAKEKTVTVVQTGSMIGCIESQRQCLKALGLGKMNRKSTIVDNNCVRGLIRKVSHLVRIEGENE
jgi:large subunit ribosomal protein L30